ncbi:MAG: dihydropteroate synthase [Treponemataceae bacterium]|nr:dihydropteroate synthase [Spirochaetales bacterium]MDY6031414.1 dihydropteroate synthase [Treponemataceae bacterium]
MLKDKTLNLKDRIYKTNKCCMIMGIINATNDSFYSKSRVSDKNQGIESALKMIEQGADILDLGAESSRPGADYVDSQLEIERLVPIVEGIRKYDKNIPISIDTRKKIVMESCVNAGADILNDISALEDDEDMADFVAETGIPAILMHKRGTSKNMMQNTHYDDAVKEVSDYLYSRADFCKSKGIAEDKIIFDVGIGFGKDLKSNLQLLRNCDKISKGYGNGNCLTLMALSRKSMISALTGKTADDNLFGTITANVFSIIAGADIVRVHDVDAAFDMINVLTGILDE